MKIDWKVDEPLLVPKRLSEELGREEGDVWKHGGAREEHCELLTRAQSACRVHCQGSHIRISDAVLKAAEQNQ